MGIKEWVSKKLLSDSARQGGASAAALKKQEAEDAKAKASAAEEAETEKAKQAVKAIQFSKGGAVKKSTSFKW